MKKILIGLVSVLFTCTFVCASAFAKWPQSIWDPLLPTAHPNWHPPMVPFPVVLIFLELGALILYQALRRPGLDAAAKYFLYLTALSLVPTILAGLHDVGVDISPDNAVLAGLSNRIENFCDFKDPLSVHVFYACMVVVLVLVRVTWRRWFYNPTIQVHRAAFLGSSIILAWVVFAAAQVGGSMVYQ